MILCVLKQKERVSLEFLRNTTYITRSFFLTFTRSLAKCIFALLFSVAFFSLSAKAMIQLALTVDNNVPLSYLIKMVPSDKGCSRML